MKFVIGVWRENKEDMGGSRSSIGKSIRENKATSRYRR